MKHILQLEESAQLAAGIVALYFIPVHIAWWIWPFLFLSPDIAFLGYAFGTKAGAIVYNLFHHKGIAIAIAAAGFFLTNDSLLFIGALLFSHSSFDRTLGYGLKYGDSFNHTHLGWGKSKYEGEAVSC